tara:strand:+ start:371 stop:559 length:189 start_codon:yes stop_codon:yes gene_type:complete
MNATEFFFALFAVFGATGIIYSWYAWIYGLDDAYQASISKKKKAKRSGVIKDLSEKRQAKAK